MRVAMGIGVACLLGVGPAPQVFRATTDVVTVDVSVLAPRGGSTRGGLAPVAGLSAEAFAVYDNSVRQQVELFRTDALPLDVTLLLDASTSVSGAMLARLKAGVVDTAAALGPSDRLRLIRLSNRLEQVFDFRPGGTPPPVEGFTAAGATSLYDGIVLAMLRPREPDRRHLIIALTDGRDTLSFYDAASAESIALLADAVLHIAVGFNGRLPSGNRSPTPVMPGQTALRSLAQATGGSLLVFDETRLIGDVFRGVIAEFRTGYVLTYVPRGVPRLGWHDIRVEVAAEGAGKYEVRARKGYSGG